MPIRLAVTLIGLTAAAYAADVDAFRSWWEALAAPCEYDVAIDRETFPADPGSVGTFTREMDRCWHSATEPMTAVALCQLAKRVAIAGGGRSACKDISETFRVFHGPHGMFAVAGDQRDPVMAFGLSTRYKCLFIRDFYQLDWLSCDQLGTLCFPDDTMEPLLRTYLLLRSPQYTSIMESERLLIRPAQSPDVEPLVDGSLRATISGALPVRVRVNLGIGGIQQWVAVEYTNWDGDAKPAAIAIVSALIDGIEIQTARFDNYAPLSRVTMPLDAPRLRTRAYFGGLAHGSTWTGDGTASLPSELQLLVGGRLLPKRPPSRLRVGTAVVEPGGPRLTWILAVLGCILVVVGLRRVR